MNALEEIKCPFYICSTVPSRVSHQGPDRYFLLCEGAVDGMTVDIRFRKKKDYMKYKHVYCENFDNYHYCPYAEVANMKYL